MKYGKQNKGDTMNKISALIKLTFVILVVSSLTFAQYDTNKSDQGTGTNQDPQTDQTTPMDRTGVLGQDEDAFRQTAMTLAQDLQSRLTLTNDQVEEVTDILVDYKDEIADIKRDKSDEMRASGDRDLDTTNRTGIETDRPDIVGDETDNTDNNEMLGGRTDYQEKFREADISANEDIEGVLEEEQLARYIQIKRDWWDTVKERVHSAAAMHNTMEDSEGVLDNNNDNRK